VSQAASVGVLTDYQVNQPHCHPMKHLSNIHSYKILNIILNVAKLNSDWGIPNRFTLRWNVIMNMKTTW